MSDKSTHASRLARLAFEGYRLFGKALEELPIETARWVQNCVEQDWDTNFMVRQAGESGFALVCQACPAGPSVPMTWNENQSIMMEDWYVQASCYFPS